MKIAIAVFIGALAIALAIVLANRWEVRPITGTAGIYRADRLTGRIEVCGVDGEKENGKPTGSFHPVCGP
jgi:hypothetical protein